MIRRLFYLLSVMALSAAPAFAQLGPKNGSELSPTNLDRVKIGQPAPDFTLEAIDGRQVSLSDFRGGKTAVLVFYRGQW